MATMKFIFLLFVEFLSVVQFNDGFPTLESNLCGSKPADVIFVLDSSGSITGKNFRRQIKFVIDVVSHFPIGRSSNRIGMVSFSNWAQLEFQLNDYETKAHVVDAIREMVQMKGDTNTASALGYVRDVMLTPENGARPDVPHIIIVLTDGRSNDPKQTALEAARSKQRKDVHLFAIGVGSEVDRLELTNMASTPSEQYVFTVENYAALETIKELLANKACQVTNPPMLVMSTSDPSVQVDQACGSGGAADVLFAGSPFANDSATKATLKFFKNIASQMDIGQDRVHVGVIPKDCDSIPSISLRTFETNTLRQLKKRSVPSTGSVLSYMNDVGFHPRHGGRANVKRIGLLIIDEPLDAMKAAVDQAIRAKKEANVELFVIAVGKDALSDEVKAIASSSNHIFHVAGYEELSSIANKVASSICPV